MKTKSEARISIFHMLRSFPSAVKDLLISVDHFSKNMVIFFYLVVSNHQNFNFEEEQVSVPLISV